MFINFEGLVDILNYWFLTIVNSYTYLNFLISGDSPEYVFVVGYVSVSFLGGAVFFSDGGRVCYDLEQIF